MGIAFNNCRKVSLIFVKWGENLQGTPTGYNNHLDHQKNKWATQTFQVLTFIDKHSRNRIDTAAIAPSSLPRTWTQRPTLLSVTAWKA